MNMDKKSVLNTWEEFSVLIADEISKNEQFAEKLGHLLSGESIETPKRRNRRAPAKLNPFVLLESGEAVLSEELSKLSIEELKDVVSEYGLDISRSALKWKDRQRLEDLIMSATKRRSSHGNAFWNS